MKPPQELAATTRPLGDFFTEAQLERICALMDEHKDDDMALTYALKRYFKTFGNELAAKGLLVDYAAYFVPWLIRSQKETQERN